MILIIIIVEFYSAFFAKTSNEEEQETNLNICVISLLHAVITFYHGLNTTLLLTKIGKVWVGHD